MNFLTTTHPLRAYLFTFAVHICTKWLICVSFAGNYLRTTLLELFFCFSVLPPLFLSILAPKCPRIVFFRKVFLSCYQLRKFCLFCGEHIFPALILPIVIVVLKVKNEIRGQRYAEVLLEINWML